MFETCAVLTRGCGKENRAMFL